MGAYQDYLAGTMVDYDLPAERIADAMSRVPTLDM
jgi:hypothetical protein